MDNQKKKQRRSALLAAMDYLHNENLIGSQADLAEKMGIGPSSLSRLKTGTYTPSDDTFYKLNEAFAGIFNMDFFRGDSDVLLVANLSEGKQPQNGNRRQSNTSSVAVDSINAEVLAMIKTSYEAALKAKDGEIAAIRRESELKDELIASLQREVADLRSRELERQVITMAKKKTSPSEVAEDTHHQMTQKISFAAEPMPKE